MYNILITGGEGYIGKVLTYHVKHHYSHLIDKVVSFDLIQGNDILDVERLSTCLKEHNIYIVVHLAACSSVTECESDKKKAYLVNVKGTKRVLEAMHKAGCNHLIYASSSAVYGNTKDDFLKESKLGIRPCSMYGYTKLSGEQVICNDSMRFPERTNIIFRMFNVIGSCRGILSPHNKPVNYGNDRLFTALTNGKVHVYGTDYDTTDGSCLRDYVSVNDVAKAYIKAIKTIIIEPEKLKGAHVFNICTSTPVSVFDIIYGWNRIQEINNKPKCEICFDERRKGDPVIVCGDNKKSKDMLNWEPIDNYMSTIVDMNT